jgi:hypothetical protein
MSKKSRRQKRKGFSWKSAAMVFAGGLVIVLAARMFRSTGGSSLSDISGGTPALSVDQKVVDWGNLKDFTEKNIRIKVTNTGTGTLRFSEKPYIQVVEGCCPPELTAGKMALGPGESTTISSPQFYMHPGMDGKHNYAVHLKTNDPAQPDLIVNVLSNWSQ